MLSTLTSCPVEEVKRVREVFPGKLLLKGIVTREDGELAVRHGLDGIVVSNHGGRAEESNIGTIESLREVIEGTRRRIPVLVDSGFRRGTDIFKALALGATAVGVGRPYGCVDRASMIMGPAGYPAGWPAGQSFPALVTGPMLVTPTKVGVPGRSRLSSE